MKLIKTLLGASVVVALTSFSVLAADKQAEEKSSLSCLDKKTFEVDAKCISTKIENSDQFQWQQTAIINQAKEANEFVMASVFMDPETLNITVVGHTDSLKTATAKVKTEQK